MVLHHHLLPVHGGAGDQRPTSLIGCQIRLMSAIISNASSGLLVSFEMAFGRKQGWTKGDRRLGFLSFMPQTFLNDKRNELYAPLLANLPR